MWMRIIDAFEDEDIEAYPIATKIGECKKEYIVVKEEGSAPIMDYSSKYDYYSILCYVPKDSYLDLKILKQKVKDIMYEKLYPTLMLTGQESAPYFDEEVKGYMSYIMYRNAVRDNRIV